jgi:hypothetical protein
MTATRTSLVLAISMLAAAQAHAAITQRLKCSAYAVGSQDLRHCMNKVQDKLSQHCLQEMVAAGEVSKAEIHGYKSRHKQ